MKRTFNTGGTTAMNTSRKGIRILALIGSLVVILAGFLLFVRPWYLRWGASDEEIVRALPGDEIVPNAAGQETRAITIHAGVEKVWPWIAQLGQDRGGFYSYDLLENIVGCRMPTVDLLRPEKQSWKIGDSLWMYPPDRAGGIGFATLRTLVPGRALGFGTHTTGIAPEAREDGSWSFILEPVDASTTRLLVRGRGAAGRSLLGVAFDRSFFEPAHFAMERRMMIGIADMVEKGDRGHATNHLQVVLWMITFVLFITATVKLLRNERWGRPLAGLLTAGVVFQILTLGQPPIGIGLLLVVLVTAVLWFPLPTARERRPATVKRAIHHAA
jgi:hypothetical protein